LSIGEHDLLDTPDRLAVLEQVMNVTVIPSPGLNVCFAPAKI